MPTVAEAAIVGFGDLHKPGIHGRTNMPQVGFVKAMKDFFGLLPGQSVIQFGAELRALSHEEKLDFAKGLRSIGIDCADPELAQIAA
jgi:hypothetical protein